MTCIEIEEKYGRTNCKCRAYNDSRPGCSCEDETVSRYSPGPVHSDETVIRLLFHPIHFDPVTGDIHPMAFKDVEDKGLSVIRARHASAHDILEFSASYVVLATAANKPRELRGVTASQVSRIRQANSNGNQRAFCVYDTGLSELPAHADVCVADDVGPRQKRKMLLDAFSKVQKLEDIVTKITKE